MFHLTNSNRQSLIRSKKEKKNHQRIFFIVSFSHFYTWNKNTNSVIDMTKSMNKSHNNGSSADKIFDPTKQCESIIFWKCNLKTLSVSSIQQLISSKPIYEKTYQCYTVQCIPTSYWYLWLSKMFEVIRIEKKKIRDESK